MSNNGRQERYVTADRQGAGHGSVDPTKRHGKAVSRRYLGTANISRGKHVSDATSICINCQSRNVDVKCRRCGSPIVYVTNTAGWYPADNGTERFWDGDQWTGQERSGLDQGPSPRGNSGPSMRSDVPRGRSPFRKVFVTAAGIALSVVLTAVIGVGVWWVQARQSSTTASETTSESTVGGSSSNLEAPQSEMLAAFPVVLRPKIGGWSYEVTLRGVPIPRFDVDVSSSPPGKAKVVATWIGSMDISATSLDEGRQAPQATATALILGWPLVAQAGWGSSPMMPDGPTISDNQAFTCEGKVLSGYWEPGGTAVSGCVSPPGGGLFGVLSPSPDATSVVPVSDGVVGVSPDVPESAAREWAAKTGVDDLRYVRLTISTTDPQESFAGGDVGYVTGGLGGGCDYLIDITTGRVTNDTTPMPPDTECR